MGAQVAYLIQKEGPFMGFFNQSFFISPGSCEGPFYVTKKLTFYDLLWDCGAVDSNNLFGCP
ncbi:hypothetical protein ES703_64650 [subsurface metagenome]